MAATEALHGLYKGGHFRGKNKHQNSYFGQNENQRSKKYQCVVCKDKHKLWQCNEFKSKNGEQRWDIARKNKLCYRCLAGKHFAKECRNSRICGIDGCLDTHNRLLHMVKKEATKSTTENNHEGEQVESLHTTNIASFISL